MPQLDKPLHELEQYLGISPKPGDFDEFWARALAEQEATNPEPDLQPASVIQGDAFSTWDLWFTGVGGARIYAKLLAPAVREEKTPALLQFHGYSGNSGDWMGKLPHVAAGWTVAAMDCRGQGGKSEDRGGVKGNTLRGHIIRGLAEDSPDKLLFRQILLDTVQLYRVVASLDWVDESRISCAGGSQGGALSVGCAALSPGIQRCISEYPFLSDYRRVWEMDLAANAYEELKAYFRFFDPFHERENEVFEKLGYIDMKNLAPRVRAETLMAITLMDNICPPSTQFAVYNNLGGPRRKLLYPDYAHEGLPGFADAAFEFLNGREHKSAKP